jgi:hypothetical protein
MHLFIATPCYGGVVTRNYMLSVIALNNALVEKGIPFTLAAIGGESLVTRARNNLVAGFRQHAEATHLLFVDADIAFPVEAVTRLLGHGGPVVATACPKKTIDWASGLALASHCDAPEDLRAATLDLAVAQSPPGELFPGEHLDRRIHDGFLRTAYAGTGMMLVARPVFDAIEKEFPELAYRVAPDEGGGDGPGSERHGFFETMIHPQTRRYLSEDFAFCHRWRRCGGEVWLDVDSRVGHEGTYLFESDLARRIDLESRRSED